jgi:RNA polymerase sigma factor (sigma-70 family)
VRSDDLVRGLIVREATRVEYELLFSSTYPSVLRTVCAILHDRGRAEEVTQDAFLKLYERWKGVVEIDHPEPWVWRVAVRMAIKQAQRDRARRTLSLVGESQTSTDSVPDIDLARALLLLPARQRAVVVLHYLEDRPVEEIAHVLGVSTSTVKQHLFRARGRLAKLLGEDQEEVTHDAH